MIVSFGDKTTEDIYHGYNSKSARRISKSLWSRIQNKLDLLNASKDIQDLQVPPSNRLEKLKGNREGYFSIRVNEQYRIVFRFETGNSYEVHCTDYH
jgi:proteic killer suppression protein